MRYLFILITTLLLFETNVYSQDSLKINPAKEQTFRKGFGIFPFPIKTMIDYRSNLNKKWAFDFKFGYSIIAIPPPELNMEFNLIHRHVRNEVFNFYNGFGITFDGFVTPGFILPIGFEIKPFEKFRNIVF